MLLFISLFFLLAGIKGACQLAGHVMYACVAELLLRTPSPLAGLRCGPIHGNPYSAPSALIMNRRVPRASIWALARLLLLLIRVSILVQL
jgi:hypothetical protein